MRFLYCNFWRFGPLGELISGAVIILHLENKKQINSAIVSGQMIQGTFRAAQSQRQSGVKISLGKSKLLSGCSLGCVARGSYNRNG